MLLRGIIRRCQILRRRIVRGYWRDMRICPRYSGCRIGPTRGIEIDNCMVLALNTLVASSPNHPQDLEDDVKYSSCAEEAI
jgi:hypothetical protein